MSRGFQQPSMHPRSVVRPVQADMQARVAQEQRVDTSHGTRADQVVPAEGQDLMANAQTGLRVTATAHVVGPAQVVAVGGPVAVRANQEGVQPANLAASQVAVDQPARGLSRASVLRLQGNLR